MDLHEALKAVLDAAKQPRQFPPGANLVPLAGEVLVTAVNSEQMKGQAWHESLTPAQETVCRWIWETCAQHWEVWEKFEVGFLYDYHIDHELAMWVRMAQVFSEFLKRHPSVNKREILGDLRQLSAGVPVKRLKNRRAKELAELWKQGAKE
jgi:hypothetical protein